MICEWANGKRAQFNALKALIDAKPSMADVNAAINANSAANSNAVGTTPTYASDPPSNRRCNPSSTS